MIDSRILQQYRTEEAKEYRRKNGDVGCPFGRKYWDISADHWSNTISTVTKDNMLCLIYM